MLEKLIYDHFVEGNTEKSAKVFNPEDTIFFNPSSFSACKRELYYKKRYTTPSNPINAVSYLKMHFGNVLHTSIQSVIKRLGILIEAEKLKVKEFDGLKFRYKTDGIIVLNRQRHIMEIKTTSSGALRVVCDAPKDADVIQMVLYMIFEGIPHGILLYIGRDSAFMEEYAVSKGDHLYRTAIAEITRKISELKQLEMQIKNGIIPGRDCQIALKNTGSVTSEKFQKDKKAYKSDWRCNFCQWHDSCWQKELNEIKNHKFYIEGEFID